ncbi:MAG: OmpA family protein [Nitrospirae bacterium]|nr:OmpA family protein [Nitrospirota bacterium]
MQTSVAKRIFLLLVVLLSMSLMVGCSHLGKAPNREGYVMYHKPLPEADRAIEDARRAGKDKECPAEFNAAKDMTDKAFEIYMACRDQEAMDIAKEAINKTKALCPPKPTPPPPPPAPKPEVKPAPALVKPEPAPIKIVLEDVHFDFDKATLTSEAKAILARDIQTLKTNSSVRVQVEGHTCAHGKDDYNMALGERRAHAVKEYLVKEGIAADRLTTISYGETRLAMPEIPTARNKNSKEAKENRRVHFEVISK